MRLILLCFLFISSLAQADIWETKAHAILPAPLRELIIGKSTIEAAKKNLGKPGLVEDQKYFWEENNFKYAVVLTFNKKVLQSIHYTFTKHAPKIDVLEIDSNDKNFESYNSKYLRLKKNSREIVIDPIKRTIYSVKIQ
jgi:hypothetical protein